VVQISFCFLGSLPQPPTSRQEEMLQERTRWRKGRGESVCVFCVEERECQCFPPLTHRGKHKHTEDSANTRSVFAHEMEKRITNTLSLSSLSPYKNLFHIYTHTHTHTYIHRHTHTYTHACKHTHTRTHIHPPQTHTQTNTYAQE